jgi:hypothetical protein
MSILFQKANLTDKSLNLANFNRMVDYLGRLANMTSPNMMIDRNPNGYVLKVLPSTSSTMSYSDYALGFSCSLDTVSVNGGYLFHGTRSPITISAATVTISADNTYVYVTYAYGSGAASITSSLTMPQDTATTLNYLLFLVTLTNGVASVEAGNIHHLGSIKISGNYA